MARGVNPFRRALLPLLLFLGAFPTLRGESPLRIGVGTALGFHSNSLYRSLYGRNSFGWRLSLGASPKEGLEVGVIGGRHTDHGLRSFSRENLSLRVDSYGFYLRVEPLSLLMPGYLFKLSPYIQVNPLRHRYREEVDHGRATSGSFWKVGGGLGLLVPLGSRGRLGTGLRWDQWETPTPLSPSGSVDIAPLAWELILSFSL